MNNTLQELVDASQEHLELNDRRRAHFKSISDIVQDSTGISNLKLASDLNYYRGGWPNEDTPPLAQTLGKKFGDAIRALLLGGSPEVVAEFKSNLNAAGISVEIITPEAHSLPPSEKTLSKIASRMEKNGNDSRVEEVLERAGGVGVTELLKLAIRHCNSLQKEICQDADVVKIEKGDAAEAAGIPRKNFVLAAKTKRRLSRIEDEGKRSDLHATLIGDAETRLEIVSETEADVA